MVPATSIELITYHCGRACKGRRGLRAHQRCCRTIDALSNIEPTIDRAAFNVNVNITGNVNEEVSKPLPALEPVAGLRLPRKKEVWGEAHSYFMAYLPLPNSFVNMNTCSDQNITGELDRCADLFQSNIYN